MAKVRPQRAAWHEPKPCFRSTEKSRGRYRHFPHTCCPPQAQLPPPPTTSISTSPPVGHLLELINLHWHVIISESPLTWRLISWCCKVYGFRQMCGKGPPLACRSRVVLLPNNPLLSRSFLLPPLIFLLSPQFCLVQSVLVGIIKY